MESGHATSLQVRTVDAADRAAVARKCGINFADSPAGQVECLEAQNKKQAVGYLALAWSGGGNVWLWGPKITTRGTESTSKVARILLAEANKRIALRKATLAQVMLNPTQEDEANWYAESGYDTRIMLELLTRPLTGNQSQLPNSAEASFDWNSIAYAPRCHARFLRALAGSYAESADCLALHRQSDPEMTLADFRSTPEFNPTLWRLFESGTEDTGCLLLNHHPDEAALEIAYLGFKPSYRGCGWGQRAMSVAFSEASRLDCQRINVGVDAQNTAAQRLYARWGFWCFSQQQVLIRTVNA